MNCTIQQYLSARKGARRPGIATLCLALFALFALTACAASPRAQSTLYTFGGLPQSATPVNEWGEATIATPTPSALRGGGLVVASGAATAPPAGSLRTPEPPWTVLSGGPTPPLAPALVHELSVPMPTASSLLVEIASLPRRSHLYKGGGVANGNYPPPLPDVELPQTLARGWDETENYLIMGTDRRPGGGDWRTDTLMLVGLDRANQRAAILSIPRDFYVDIPGYGWGRINQTDYLGELRGAGNGPELLGSVIETNLGVPIHHWMRIHMDGFIPVVDALGGIDITLDTPFYDMWQSADGASRLELYLPAGENHLDGNTAYFFSRLRYVGSDIGRASRQRAVLWALREKLLQGNTLLRLPELYAAYQQYVSTDLTIVDLLLLAQVAVTLDRSEVHSGGIGLGDLRSYVTNAGAQVLIMDDPWHVREVVEGVWDADAPTLADSFRGNLPGTILAAPAAESTLNLGATSPVSTTGSITGTVEMTESVGSDVTPESLPESVAPPSGDEAEIPEDDATSDDGGSEGEG